MQPKNLMLMAAVLALGETGPDAIPKGAIANRGQAMPRGARIAAERARDERKASAKAAAQELVAISNQTLVVAHLHPRWLRECVERLMDMGEAVTLQTIVDLKAAKRIAHG